MYGYVKKKAFLGFVAERVRRKTGGDSRQLGVTVPPNTMKLHWTRERPREGDRETEKTVEKEGMSTQVWNVIMMHH